MQRILDKRAAEFWTPKGERLALTRKPLIYKENSGGP
jgi:hypothetical protein